MTPTRGDIQRAHDILVAVILGELPLDLSKAEKSAIMHYAEVLCWLLDHDHNPNFAINLRRIERKARELGYELKEIAE